MLSCCWALCRSFSTLWSFSEVSWRIFSCDTVTVFLTFIFPTKVRTSPCSFLMIPLACMYKRKKDRSKRGVDHFQNSQLLFFPYNRDAVRSLSFQSNQYQYKQHPIKQDVVHCVGHSCILLILYYSGCAHLHGEKSSQALKTWSCVVPPKLSRLNAVGWEVNQKREWCTSLVLELTGNGRSMKNIKDQKRDNEKHT